MSDAPDAGDDHTVVTGRTKHGELTIDQLAGLAPGLGRLMREIGERYWLLYYAAQGGNWNLAHYAFRGMRKMFKTGGLTRPKMAAALSSYDEKWLTPLGDAIKAHDWHAFSAAYGAATDEANRVHVALGYGYIEWRLPNVAPQQLTLVPVVPPAGNGEAE